MDIQSHTHTCAKCHSALVILRSGCVSFPLQTAVIDNLTSAVIYMTA